MVLARLNNACLFTILILLFIPASVGANRTRWVSVEEIYAKGKHNAWPDMCRWRDKIYVVFPGHGKGHAETHGIVILESQDTKSWKTTLDTPPSDWQLEDDETWPAETIFFLPTEERLYLLYWAIAKGNTEVPAEKKTAAPATMDGVGWYREQLAALGDAARAFSPDARQVHDRWSDLEQAATITGSPLVALAAANICGKHYMVGFTGEAQQWEITPELKPMIPVADDLPLSPKRGLGTELFRAASLFVSDKGLEWTKVSHIGSHDDGEPGLAFRPDGRALVVSRNGAGASTRLLTQANPPTKNGKSSSCTNRYTKRP